MATDKPPRSPARSGREPEDIKAEDVEEILPAGAIKPLANNNNENNNNTDHPPPRAF